VWDFIASPANLKEIIPVYMRFVVTNLLWEYWELRPIYASSKTTSEIFDRTVVLEQKFIKFTI
jgi:hypothetical protein